MIERLTPSGVSGVAVLRVRDEDIASVVGLLRLPSGAPCKPRLGVPVRSLLQIGDSVLDDVLVVDRGTRGLELHTHGAPAVLNVLHAHFGLQWSEAADPASYLLQTAMSVQQLELALEQRQFNFASCCASIARLPPALHATEFDAVVDRSRAAMAMANPQRVVFMGRQNAGKSSLFNRLLCRERAITGCMPGLTRDAILERTSLSGFPFELVDTAGEGPTASAIDTEAVRRGRELRRGAITVLVIDAARGPTSQDRELAACSDLVIANKSDLGPRRWTTDVPCHLTLSAVSDEAPDLRAAVGECIRTFRGLPAAGPVGGFAALTATQFASLAGLCERTSDARTPP